LAPGTYSVTVDASGFAKSGSRRSRQSRSRDDGTTRHALGRRRKEVVEVTSQAELVETSRSSTTDTVGQRRIDNLPFNGRNYINFTSPIPKSSATTRPTPSRAHLRLNMSGQRGRSNLVNVDGADATDNSTNGVRSTVSQEAVQEFQIITNSYAAEYGRAPAASSHHHPFGSNDFHGDVYGYLRNRDFQAVNPSRPAPRRLAPTRPTPACRLAPLSGRDQERQNILLRFL